MKWEKVEIGQLGDVVTGNTPPRKNPELYGDFIPFIKPTDMEIDRRFTPNPEECYSELAFEKYRKSLIPKGATCVVTIGSIGKKITQAITECFINQAVNAVIPNVNYDADFVFYLLKNNLDKVKGLDSGTSSGRENVSKSSFSSIEVKVVNHLPTQRKIASILSAYDDLIENNLKRIKLLEEKARLHYIELMQEMSYSKTKREEYIKDCLAFYIGGGWGEEEYKEGFTEPAFVIRGTDIPDAKKGEVKGVPFRFHKESNLASRSIKAGDVVFEVSGGSKGQPVGRSILITEKMLQLFGKPVICASFCKMLRPNEKITPEFFYLYLLASHENGVIAQYEKHSASNIVNYGFEEFIGEQKITIPKDTALKAFTEKVKPIFTIISTLGEQNSKLREARDILLPRLMNGQIEV